MPTLDYPPSVLKGDRVGSPTRSVSFYNHSRSRFDTTMQTLNPTTDDDASAAEEVTRLYRRFRSLPRSNVVDRSPARKRRHLDFQLKRHPSGKVKRPSSVRLNAELRQQYKEKKADNPYAKYRREIESYALLPKGWDSYQTEAPRQPAINLALHFLALVEARATPIKWVSPTADDSIMITLETTAVRQEWEFYGGGQTAVMIRKAGGPKEYYDVDEKNFASWLPC